MREYFEKALDLLEDPSRWCQRDVAVDENDWPVRPKSDRACRWCVSGALSKFDAPDEVWKKLSAVSQRLYGFHYTTVNDELSHEAVLKILEVSIKES